MYDSKIPKCLVVKQKKSDLIPNRVLLLLPYLFLLNFHTPLSLQYVYAYCQTLNNTFHYLNLPEKKLHASTNKMNQKILLEKIKR